MAGAAVEVGVPPLLSYEIDVCVKNSAVQFGITGTEVLYTQLSSGATSV
jgi:hypothetical protein